MANYMDNYAQTRKDQNNRTTLLINHKGTVYEPPVLDDFEVQLERKGTPGKLTFTLLRNQEVEFVEGDAVRFRISHTWVFYGWIFERSMDAEGNIKCTCYDQTRYLKNKDTYIYENKTASELIQMISKDFHLKCGFIEDTKYKIKQRIEEDKSLIDIILNALDETLAATGKLYVLYDNCGKLMLKNIEDMAFNLVLDPSTFEDYDYKTSIDDEVYNQIKLAYPNKETGKYDIFMTKDSNNIQQWGVLQYYEKLDTPGNAKAMANELLKLYNKTKRSITIKDALGEVRVRPGSRIIVNVDLGDYTLKSFMIVESQKWKYKDGRFTMDLTLINKDFSAPSYSQNTSTNNSFQSSSNNSNGGSSSGGNQKAVQLAKSQLGKPYRWGATGPNSFDCSGLMYWVAKQMHKTIPRTSIEQSKGGIAVSKANLQPGDLVFFGSPVHHVGMYVGGGQYLHAPKSNDVVKISNLGSRRDYHNARRYF